MYLKENFKKVGYTLFILFALTVFISKAAVNISGSLLILFTIICLIGDGRKRFWGENKYIVILLIPLCIGLVLSLFSQMGPKGVVAFMARYRFFLMALPFALFIKDKKDLNGLFVALNVSGFLGMIYGFLNSDIHNLWGHFNGLHIVGRNADMIFTICLLNIVFLFRYKFEKGKRGKLVISSIVTNTLLLISVLMFIGQRGPLLGFCFGLILFSLFFKRKILVFIVAAGLLLPLLIPNSWLLTRVKSIGDLQNNLSNTIRLHLYKSGVDFVIDENLFLKGTGAKKSEKPFIDFFKSKPPQYQEKYNQAMVNPGNFHNSFLQMAVEAGLVYLLFYLASIFYLLVTMIKKMKYLDNNDKVYLVAAIVVTISFLISQFFHGGLYRYPGIPFYIIFLGGCLLVNMNKKRHEAQVE